MPTLSTVFLLLIGCAFAHAQEATFRVKHKTEKPTSYLQLPPYIEGKENVLWLDSLPQAGTSVWLWSDKIIPTRFHFTSPGFIAHPGTSKYLDHNSIWFLQWAKNSTDKLYIVVTEVFAHDKVYPAYWAYRIKFR